MLRTLCLATMLVFVYGRSPPKANGRLFGKVHTKTVMETKIVTSLVPSSCVQVDATLPPCRNVRYLRFPKLSGISFFHESDNKVNNNQKNVVESNVHSTPLGWGEYLGLYAPTVTVTETEIHISTVQDPRTTVTFAVKGCRPQKLPLDLDRCPQEQPSKLFEDTSSIIQADPSNWLTPSSTIFPTNTLYQESPDNSLPEFSPEENFNLIEPSTQGSVENLAGQQPTEALTPLA